MTRMKGLRCVRLEISLQLLCDMLKAGPPRAFEVVEHPLPDDAKIIGVSMTAYGSIMAWVESAAFEPANDPPPIIPSPVLRDARHLLKTY